MNKNIFLKLSIFTIFGLVISILLTSNITLTNAQQIQQDTPTDPPQAIAQIAQQTPTPMPEISTYTNKTSFTFENLGVAEIILRFPSISEVSMNLPNHWAIVASEQRINLDLPTQNTGKVDYTNSYIDVHYDLFNEYGNDQVIPEYQSGYPYVGLIRPNLEVYVDDFLAKSFRPEPGTDHWERIPIPSQAVRNPGDNPLSERVIRFEYYSNNDYYCYYTGLIKIYDDTRITLSFKKLQPDLNLADFPRPLIQEAFLPETLVIVIPDNYNDFDLGAVANMANSMGNLGTGNVNLKIVTASQATNEVLSNTSAIFMGTPNKNSVIANFYKQGILPTKLNSDGSISRYKADKSVAPILLSDGVLQLIPSNQNPDFTYLIITGQSDEAVLRAAKSLSSPPLGAVGALIIVEESWDIRPTPTPTATMTPTATYVPTPTPFGTPVIPTAVSNTPVLTYNPEDTFLISTYRYTNRSFFGIGANYSAFSFFVPRNWVVLDGAMLQLNYTNSTNLKEANSSISVLLNGTPAGSAPISPERGEKRILIPLDKREFLPGSLNTITFEVNNATQIECANVIPRAYWTAIRDNSILKIPHDVLTAEELAQINQVYPHPIYYLLADKNILLSLPSKPTIEELNTMVKFAYSLGSSEPDLKFLVSTNPDEDFSAEKYEDYNVVMMGRPSRNPHIAKIDNFLPQPFEPGEDTLIQRSEEIAFQIPTDVSIGIVQVIASPWDFLRGVTVITGTTEEAYQWAIDRITNIDTIFEFYGGDITFVANDRIEVFQSSIFKSQALDTVVNVISATKTTLEPVPTKSGASESVGEIDKYIVPTESPIAGETHKVVNYLIIVLVAAAIVMLVLVGIQTAKGGRRN